MHPLRTENSSTPLQLWTKGLLTESSLHLQGMIDELLDEVYTIATYLFLYMYRLYILEIRCNASLELTIYIYIYIYITRFITRKVNNIHNHVVFY